MISYTSESEVEKDPLTATSDIQMNATPINHSPFPL